MAPGFRRRTEPTLSFAGGFRIYSSAGGRVVCCQGTWRLASVVT